MVKKKQTEHKSNLVWWIIGVIAFIACVLIMLSNKAGKFIDAVGDVVYETSIVCDTVDSNTIQCDCDVIIGKNQESYKFSNKINATSCDNNICSDLCRNYAEELVNK